MPHLVRGPGRDHAGLRDAGLSWPRRSVVTSAPSVLVLNATTSSLCFTAAIEAQIGLDAPSLSLSALDESASLGQSNDGKHNRQVACRFLRRGVIRSPALQGAALETL
jgi:hypothetical protein